MNFRKTIHVLLVAGATLIAAGCSNQLFSERELKYVEFGSSSNKRPLTRTAYGYYNSDDKIQEINWTSSDEIRVYSPNSARRIELEQGITDPAQLYYWADYQVVPSEDDPTKGGITRIGDDGLAWSGDHEEYVFYSVYPRLRLNSGIPEDEGKGLEPDGVNGKFPLYIPDRQSFSEKGNISSYGFMTATATVPYEEYDKVQLDFEPAFSTFEISIRSAGDAIGLKEFNLISNGTAGLAGDYSIEYENGQPVPKCSTASITTITVNLTGKSAPAASENKDLVFSVLTVPQDLNNLSVSFTTSQNITRTLQLKDASGTITFEGGKKHRIYGLVLPNGELLVSVDTAPWVIGAEHTYTTIEDASTVFDKYQAYLNGQELWVDTYVAIAPGYEQIHVDPDDPSSATTNRPMYSTMFTLTTVSVNVELQLISDNDKVGFVQLHNGVFTEPSATLTIPASSITADRPYGTENITSYFVVPLEGASDGDVAGISLIRTDSNTPVAYTHQDLPGTTDHTKVRFMVLTPDKYLNDTVEKRPTN